MGTEDAHGLGYERVDDDPNISVLLSTMEATAGWEATRRLRAWERDQLRLGDGQRLLDVGCGLGEAALALALDLGPDEDLAERVRAAMRTERGRASNIGGRLHDLVSTAGLAPLAVTEATHIWTSWNPDESLAPTP